MANTGRMTTGTAPRLLQYGLDAILKHTDRVYLGESSKIFTRYDTNGKGFYESLMMSGMSPAAAIDEGASVGIYGSYNQSFGWHTPLVKYAKSVRVTEECIEDNVYEDIIPQVTKELIKAINVNDDMQAVYIFDNSTTSGVTYRDGKTLADDAHPTQAGPTFDNKLLADLSEDAVESAVQQIYGYKNEDGILGDYESDKLIVPTALMHVMHRICGSPYRTSSTDNDINAIYAMGAVKEKIVWKRLASSTGWYLTSDCNRGSTRGFVMADKFGIRTSTSQEPNTKDTVCDARVRRLWTVDDPRCVLVAVGS